MMRFLRDAEETASMYNKHIPQKYQSKQMQGIMTGLCMSWFQEKKLKDILNDSRYEGDDGADNIDETIELLQNTISFSVPLLLKPIFDIKNPESYFLSYMQLGAFNIANRLMIEMGIARETALYFYDNFFQKVNYNNLNKIDIEESIRQIITKNYSAISCWVQVQLDFLK